MLGKKQRLQALGHYYEVITGAAAGNNATEAYTNCLANWRAKREAASGAPFANDAALEADMQAQIRTFVLEGGALPAVGAEVRILLPGALTFNNRGELGAGGIADGTALTSHRFNDEGTMWAANLPLGKIPIIALVERDTGGGVWVPAPNERVHFRLVPPFHDAAATELADVNLLRNQSEQGTAALSAIVAGAGPRPFITNATGAGGSFVAADPQRYNAHQSRGGKRGLAVLNNIFESLPAPAFPNMNALQASAHTHAVRAQTNAIGEAGILLKPSRFGGDRYRLRIFVDPIGGRASDGTGANAVVQDRGRFCVWKHVLWTRYLQKPLPVLPAVNTTLGKQSRLAILGYDTGPLDGVMGSRTTGAIRAFQTNNHPPLAIDGDAGPLTQPVLDQAVTTYITNAGQTLGVMNFATVQAQFQQMYCLL
ncbi:MAG: peptidoglycan-binding domain-containing protein, partial [Acidobacteriota bacterium]